MSLLPGSFLPSLGLLSIFGFVSQPLGKSGKKAELAIIPVIWILPQGFFGPRKNIKKKLATKGRIKRIRFTLKPRNIFAYQINDTVMLDFSDDHT